VQAFRLHPFLLEKSMADEIAYVGDTSGDEFLDVTFYSKIVDGAEVEFINVKVPGDKTLEIDVEATEDYKRRFGRKYSAWKQMSGLTGTPIEEWDDVPEGFRRELVYLGFRYVEQVAGAPDSAFTRVMGGLQWRVKAQAFLNRGKVGADDLVKQQQAQIEQLQAQMATLLGDAPKRGRKPKETTDEVESEAS
jgi:hypothetical protein